jgi:hypothetical protein
MTAREKLLLFTALSALLRDRVGMKAFPEMADIEARLREHIRELLEAGYAI